jgi:phage terminase large subunit GpA-like protein
VEINVYRAPERLTTYDWVRANLRLQAGPMRGHLWDPATVPYARAIMDCWDDPRTREILLAGPSQGTTKTTIAQGCVLAALARRPTSVGFGFSVRDQAQRVFEERIIPYMRGVPALRRLISPSRHAVTGTAVELVDGSHIYGMWSGSDPSYSSVSMEIVHISEEDDFEDPAAVDKMRERKDIYELVGTAKVFRETKIRGEVQARRDGEERITSSIYRDALRRASTWMRWAARCPACGHIQIMRAEQIKAVSLDGRPVTDPRRIRDDDLARYQCEECKMLWSDAARREALRTGEARCERGAPGGSVVFWRLCSWETMGGNLSRILADRLEAEGDPLRLKNWHNNNASEPYRQVIRTTDADVVRACIRRDVDEETGEVLYPSKIVPPEALALTCGVDVQQRGFWFVVRAWARERHSWLVDYGFIPRPWSNLEDFLLNTSYPARGLPGIVYPIYRTFVDIGGGRMGSDRATMTDDTLAWLQRMGPYGRIHGCKGAARAMSLPVRNTHWIGGRGKFKLFQGAVDGYMVDPNSLKDLIVSRLNPSSPQVMWLHAETREYYLRMLTSERKIITDTGRAVWDAGKRANHLLDCEVYAAAAADPACTPALHLLSAPHRISPRPSGSRPEARGNAEHNTQSRRRLW